MNEEQKEQGFFDKVKEGIVNLKVKAEEVWDKVEEKVEATWDVTKEKAEEFKETISEKIDELKGDKPKEPEQK